MRKKQQEETKDNHSLRKVIVFCLVVLFLIVISVVIRFALLIKDSTYDGKNRYTIAAADDKRQVVILSFNPEEKNISKLIVTGSSPKYSLQQIIGVPIDATFTLTKDTSILQKEPADVLASFFFNRSIKRVNITDADIIRLWLLAKSIPPKDVSETTFKATEELSDIDEVSAGLFSDARVVDENVSIEIVNSTETPGLGKRLERVIKNMGGSVIAVSNSQDKEMSKIYYFESTSYTKEKVEKMLRYPSEVTTKRSVADIKIIIGDDSVKTDKF